MELVILARNAYVILFERCVVTEVMMTPATQSPITAVEDGFIASIDGNWFHDFFFPSYFQLEHGYLGTRNHLSCERVSRQTKKKLK